MATLLVASGGGHLAQLHRLHGGFAEPGSELIWLTFDTPQSQSLLRGERVEFVDYIEPRDWRAVARLAWNVRRKLRSWKVTHVISTGAAVALGVLPTARSIGIRCTYIESAARAESPSLTGRLMACVPGVETYTQYRRWAGKKWKYAQSVFDGYRSADLGQSNVERILVSLGTIKPYQFQSLVRRVLQVAPPSARIIWQLGSTEPIEGALGPKLMPRDDLLIEMARADVVIAHSGIGSALDALHAGKIPILVPRRASRNEHVDDHQQYIAEELSARGLAIYCEVDTLMPSTLVAAAGRRAVAV